LDKILIPLPPQIQQVQSGPSSGNPSHYIRQSGVGAEDRARALSDKGGLLEGFGGVEKDFFAKAAGLVDKAAAALGAGIGSAAESGFILAADGLDQCIQGFEGPLNFAARGFLFKSREDVVKVYTKAIENLKLQRPVDLVRGELPHGPAQYKACRSNALSAELAKLASLELSQALLPLCVDVVARNEVQRDWDALMWKYDQANAKLKAYVESEGFQQANGETDLAKSLQEGPLELDLNKYIVEQTVHQLAVLMGEEEAKMRSAPPQRSCTPLLGTGAATEARMPLTFQLCFSNDLDGHLTLGKCLPIDCYLIRNK